MARLFDLATGQEAGQPLRHRGRVLAVAFSSDGRRAAAACSDQTAWVWDLSTATPIGPPLPHGNQVVSVAFSPDGDWLATGCLDDTARIWEVASGRQAGRSMNQGEEASALAFSPDGTLLLTGSDDRTVRFWDRLTGRPIGPALQHSYSLFAVAFHPDGKSIRAASGGPETLEVEVRSAQVPVPKTGDREQVRTWCEVVTGLELDETEGVHILEYKAWRDRHQLLLEERASRTDRRGGASTHRAEVVLSAGQGARS
jgi:WD40 repeat protein